MIKKKIIIVFFFLSFFNISYADYQKKIILNLKKINNLSFEFKQTINEKTENGSCIIEYPKKIFCAYDNDKKKIIVSNGKSLVIKNKHKNQYYIYKLSKTPLELILDKNFLIYQIKIKKSKNHK
jgi:outer membrane lipoprotein-sorting protein